MSKTVKEVLLENKAVLGERITEKNFHTLREGDFLFGIRTFQNPQKTEEDLGVRDYGNRFVAEDVEPGSDLVLCLYMTKKYNAKVIAYTLGGDLATDMILFRIKRANLHPNVKDKE